MKKIIRFIALALPLWGLGGFSFAQNVYVCKGGDYTVQTLTDGLAIDLADMPDSITFTKPQMPNVVNIVYNDAKATVSIPSFLKNDVTCTSGTNPEVQIACTNVTDEITYNVSGSSTAGSLTIAADYKMTISLNNVTLTSTTGGAVNIQCGKRIAVVMAPESVNTFEDAPNGTQKACFYTKGHLEFSGAGTLNVAGNANHAIAAKEYVQIKKSVKAINILRAANDAIHMGQYFLMNGGEVSITSTTVNDGIQVDRKLDANDRPVEDPENTGNVIIKGGVIRIVLDGQQDSKGIKAEGDIEVSGGQFDITAISDGSRGISADGSMTISEDSAPTDMTIHVLGDKCTLPEDKADPHNCWGIKVDGTLTVNAGTITVDKNGDTKKKAIRCNKFIRNGGTIAATVKED